MENETMMTEKHKKQKRLSVGLRIVSMLMAGLAALVFSILCSLKKAIPYLTMDEVWLKMGGSGHQDAIAYDTWVDLMHGHMIFSVIAVMLVLYILGIFQRVCVEIGRDNSFSVENVKNFNKMAWTAVATSALYVVKMVVYVSRFIGAGYTRIAEVLAWGYTIALVVFLLFAYLCRSLAKLIFNAYEVQTENDLTI